MRKLSNQLSQMENLFGSSKTGEMWCVGTALGDVMSRLNSALSLFDAVELPDQSLLITDELDCDENTKLVDEKCRELRESVMLVVQTLYKTRETDGESCTEDQQTESAEGSVDGMPLIVALIHVLFNVAVLTLQFMHNVIFTGLTNGPVFFAGWHLLSVVICNASGGGGAAAGRVDGTVTSR